MYVYSLPKFTPRIAYAAHCAALPFAAALFSFYLSLSLHLVLFVVFSYFIALCCLMHLKVISRRPWAAREGGEEQGGEERSRSRTRTTIKKRRVRCLCSSFDQLRHAQWTVINCRSVCA